MRAFPLLAACALALSACGGGGPDSDSNDLAVDTLTAENLVVENAAPAVANDIAEQSSPAATAEPSAAAPRPAAPPARSKSRPPAKAPAPKPPPPPKTAPEPEPDPHAGHDMNNMTGN